MTGPYLITRDGVRVDLRTPADRAADCRAWLTADQGSPTRDRYRTALDTALNHFPRRPE